MPDKSNLQKCDEAQSNTLNSKPVLPIVDGHCHIFGQSLYEGGDIIDAVEDPDPSGVVEAVSFGAVSKGLRRFLAYTMARGKENAKAALDSIPKIKGGNEYAKDAYARALIPLLLDLGYTPLQGIPISYRSQEELTEGEQIARTDQTQVNPDTSKLATLRLESLYCKETEDYTGDDEIRIEVYNGTTALTVLPTFTVDHNNQTRMLNEDVCFDPVNADIRVKLYELDDDSADDLLGTESLLVDGSSSGWKTASFVNSSDASSGTHYELTYSVTQPQSGGSSSGATGESVLQLEYLKCIKQEDLTGNDAISIEVDRPKDSPNSTDKVPELSCDEGQTYGLSNRFTFQNGVRIKLWELDSGGRDGWVDSDDALGSVDIGPESAQNKVASFTGDGADYELAYSVMPGSSGSGDDGFYKSGEKYLWFKRDRETLRGTIRSLSRNASQFPGRVWPMVPFEPRRPDGLELVKEAIDKLGFAGAKLYSRCGWMPTNNREMYGEQLGAELDKRLQAFYKYVTENDLPVLVHCSPTGYPPNDNLVYPRPYHETKPPVQTNTGLPFPLLPKVDDAYRGSLGKKALDAEVAYQCVSLARYSHYVQTTTSPYAWEGVFTQFPKLRLCLGHAGSAVGIYWRYKDAIDNEIKQDTDGLGESFEDSELFEDAVPGNPFAGPNDPTKSEAVWTFKERFIEQATQMVSDANVEYESDPIPMPYYPNEIRPVVEEFISGTGDWGTFWTEWFLAWDQIYHDDWTTKIVSLQEQYDNVYMDISYLSGDDNNVFVMLLKMLIDDAQNGTKNGQILADRLIVGTDWFMTEISEISGSDFWNLVKDKDALPSSHTLWRKWTSENALNWLNLRDRLGGNGLTTLEDFYNTNLPKGNDPETGKPYKLLSWWSSLDLHYTSAQKT